VKAKVVAKQDAPKVDAPKPEAIPWLLLSTAIRRLPARKLERSTQPITISMHLPIEESLVTLQSLLPASRPARQRLFLHF
jgi:hypothetical protein